MSKKGNHGKRASNWDNPDGHQQMNKKTRYGISTTFKTTLFKAQNGPEPNY